MKKPYTFIKRSNRKYIYVRFEHLPGKEFSTGTADMIEAVVYAEAMLRKDFTLVERDQKKMTFGKFAQGFFTAADPHGFRKRNEAKNKHYEETFYFNHQGRLTNYIMPKFESYLLSSINKNMIDDWFMSLKAPNGKELSANTRNKILFCLRIIMQTAVDEGYIASDPTERILTITENDTKNRQPFTAEELYTFFPADDNELIEIWGGIMWSVYFLIMRDTGWRPAEVAGLKKSSYYPNLNGIYTECEVVGGVEKQRIKTTGKGKDYKVGLLTERTEKLLNLLISVIKSDFLFITTEGNFVQPDAANKHLRAVAKKVGIDLKGRTQYGFRHSFETLMVGNIHSKALLELMAHTGFRPEYDHRTPEMILKQLEPVKETLNSVFEPEPEGRVFHFPTKDREGKPIRKES